MRRLGRERLEQRYLSHNINIANRQRPLQFVGEENLTALMALSEKPFELAAAQVMAEFQQDIDRIGRMPSTKAKHAEINGLYSRMASKLVERVELNAISLEFFFPESRDLLKSIHPSHRERVAATAVNMMITVARKLQAIKGTWPSTEELQIYLKAGWEALKEDVFAFIAKESNEGFRPSDLAMRALRVVGFEADGRSIDSTEPAAWVSSLSGIDREIARGVYFAVRDRDKNPASITDQTRQESMALLLSHERRLYGDSPTAERGVTYWKRVRSRANSVYWMTESLGAQNLRQLMDQMSAEEFELVSIVWSEYSFAVNRESEKRARTLGQNDPATKKSRVQEALMANIPRLRMILKGFADDPRRQDPAQWDDMRSEFLKRLGKTEAVVKEEFRRVEEWDAYAKTLNPREREVFEFHAGAFRAFARRRASWLSNDTAIQTQIERELVESTPQFADTPIRNLAKRSPRMGSELKKLDLEANFAVMRYRPLTPTEVANLPEAWRAKRDQIPEEGGLRAAFDTAVAFFLVNTTEMKADVDIFQHPEILDLIHAMISSRAAEGISMSDARNYAGKAYRWVSQALQWEGATPHKLTDRPKLIVLAGLMKYRTGLTTSELEHFDLAAPRFSRWISNRAAYAANGDEAAARRFEAKLIEAHAADFVESVKRVRETARTKTQKGIEQTDPEKKAEQIMTDVKAKSRLFDEERTRMEVLDSEGRSLIENVRNILMSEKPLKGVGYSLQKYVPHDERTENLGHQPDVRKANIHNLILTSLAKSVVYYPFDVEAGRSPDQFKSHHTDRCLQLVEAEILRGAERLQKDRAKAGTSLDYRGSDASDPGAALSDLLPSRTLSPLAALASNEGLNPSLFETSSFIRDSWKLSPDQLIGFSLLMSRVVADDKGQMQALSSLPDSLKAFALPSFQALQVMKDSKKESALEESMAQRLIHLTNYRGDPQDLLERARDFIGDLKDSEREALDRWLDVGDPNRPRMTYGKLPDILGTWFMIAGVEKNSKQIAEAAGRPNLPDYRASFLTEAETRKFLKYSKPKGMNADKLTELFRDFQRETFITQSARITLAHVLHPESPALYEAAEQSRRIEMTRVMTDFAKAWSAYLTSQGYSAPAPLEPWWLP